ncbi:MAG: lysophospholipid acyltransferase family protein [Thiohalocapsa sp.]|jgi:KDO2-lipid IV(A) lauroyltransferase
MKVKHRLEYAALRILSAAFNALPYRIALTAAWPLAWCTHWLFRYRTDVARQRIQEVFPGFSPRQVRHTAWVSFRNLVFNGIEMLRAHRLSPAWLEQHVDMSNVFKVVCRHLESRPVIAVGLHMGNWELAGHALEQGGIPAFYITRSQRNPLTTQFINSRRVARGSEVIGRDDPDLIRKAVAMLKRGKTLAILLDVRARKKAMSLSFLGKTAEIAAGGAYLAWLSGAVVLPYRVTRKGWTRHEVVVLDEILIDRKCSRDEEMRRVTQEALEVLGAQALRMPEQYFWYNKRWVLEALAPVSETHERWRTRTVA